MLVDQVGEIVCSKRILQKAVKLMLYWYLSGNGLIVSLFVPLSLCEVVCVLCLVGLVNSNGHVGYSCLCV